MDGEKKAQKRERLIKAAMSKLEDKCYNEIRVEEITSELKLAKSMFFYYFDSKAALYLEILYRLHKDLVARFLNILGDRHIESGEEFKTVVMDMTDIYIKDFVPLIKLTDDERLIYSECSGQQAIDTYKRIGDIYDALYSRILEKTGLFSRNEIFYVFEVQRHFLRSYYRQMVVNDKKPELERKSLYEFRVLRMLRYFINGIIYEKKANHDG